MYLAVFVFILVLGTFLGYIFHRMFHCTWSGKFYQSHMTHHEKLYPSTDYCSDKYRDSGKDNTVYLFGIIFSPLFIGTALLGLLAVIPIPMAVMILVEMSIISWLNSNMHDSFHITKSFWDRFGFFAKLRQLHFQHHVDMKSNFGIFSFFWDRLLRTYREK